MSSEQHFGFHFYSAAISPQELRLGNIVWNYKKPIHPHSYQHEDSLSARIDLFDRSSIVPLDVDFANPATFKVGIGFQNIAWLKGHFGDNKTTHIKSDQAEGVRVYVNKLAEFEDLTHKTDKARAWLNEQLSAAFTVASQFGRGFRRPKLWLCTGLITIDKGSYEVSWEGGKGGGMTLQDPTGLLPIGAEVEIDLSPTSKRLTGITQTRIIAAQWMLLYCRNIKSMEDPATADYVRLTATYAENQVKEGEQPLSIITTDRNEIEEAEKRGQDLFAPLADDEPDFSDEKEIEKDVEEDTIDLFEPMFPEPGTKEYNLFEKALKYIRGGEL